MATGFCSSNTCLVLNPRSDSIFRNFPSSYPTSWSTQKRSSIRCQSTGTDEPKTKMNLFDNASNLLTNLLSGGRIGSMPIAEGAVTDLFDRPLFFSLYDWFLKYGSVYKLAFGPKAFVVVSDPIVARHILRENAFSYDKGVLAEILEPIMGKGLIPADLDTWKQRRRVIAPGFHSSYLEAMAKVFTECADRTMLKFDKLIEQEESGGGKLIELDLETEFSNLALDIIGLGVFNYDFGSITKESPVIKAVYGTLFEAEHRSTFYIPYWNIPLARWIVPRQRKFQSDLKVINDCLDGLIRNAKETRQETDVEKLQQRDYLNLKDASLLLVRNIPLSARPEDLRVPFERYGPIRDVYLPKNYHTGEPRGFGFVKFRYAKDAAEAKAHLNNTVIGGRDIRIVFAEDNRKTPREMRKVLSTSGPSARGSYRRHSSPSRRYHSYSRSASPARRDSRC